MRAGHLFAARCICFSRTRHSSSNIPTYPRRWEDRSPVSVGFPGGTMLQALNSIIRAHGSATWRLGYRGDHAVVALSALDFQGPVALERPSPRRSSRTRRAALRGKYFRVARSACG
jgi:hypothetical protein